MWGLIELDKLAYAASLTPFIPAGVKEHPREEAFNILRSAPDPYERFREVAKAANAGRVKLAEPWESLRVLIMPKPSEERRLMKGRAYSKLDEGKKKGLFYAVLALEEAFGVYRSALRKYAVDLKETMQRVEVGEEPFKRVMYVADVGQIKQLTKKEDKAFEKALEILRKRLNEYAVKYSLRDLLDVDEDVARRLAEAMAPELSEFKDVSFGAKALAALIAYREHVLGRRSAFGVAAWHWLEGGGSAWLLYYTPKTAYDKAERAGVEKPTAVEELVAEALRRLFLKPGADYYSRYVEGLMKGGRLAPELEKETESSYMFRLFRLEEGGKLVELEGVKLWIAKVGESIVYTLELDARWRELFRQELNAAEKAAEELRGRWTIEDPLLYMLGWVASDVAISGGLLQMSTSHLWQLAETQALFDWSYVTLRGVGLTLEGPKPQFRARTSLEKLDEAIRRSAEGGWLRMLGVEARSWEGLRRWVVENWDVVVETAVRRLGEGVRGELEALRDKLDNDKIAREVVAPALLLLQAERLGVGEETLKYLAAVASGAIGGDGYVSAARREVGLTSGERVVALLWAAVLAAYGIEAEVRRVGGAFNVVASGDDAVKLAGLYFLYGPSLLEGDERIINYKLAEAVELGAEGLSVSWERLRRRTPSGPVAADLTISVGGASIKYNVYLRDDTIMLRFQSTDRSRAELATHLLRLAGVAAEVKKVGNRDEWLVYAYTDRLAAGHEKLRKALAEIVRTAVKNGLVDEKKAEGWLEKLEEGRILKEGWPKYEVRLTEGALMIRFSSPNPDSIERRAQQLREMGLEEGVHFTVKMPEGGGKGYVSILKEGLAHAAWLSVHGSGRQRELAVDFVEHILQRAREAGEDVRKKAEEIVKEGKERASLELKGFEKEVEVNGRTYVVKVIGGEAVEEDRNGRKLLRIRIVAEVGGVRSDYTITYGRYGDNNKAMGYAYASAKAPGGREADAERFSALVKALTGREPNVYRRSDGKIEIECYEGHLEGFMLYKEFFGTIMQWLKDTSRRGRGADRQGAEDATQVGRHDNDKA